MDFRCPANVLTIPAGYDVRASGWAGHTPENKKIKGVRHRKDEMTYFCCREGRKETVKLLFMQSI